MNKKTKILPYTAGICSVGLTSSNAAIINEMIDIDLDSEPEAVYIDIDTGAFTQTYDDTTGFDIGLEFSQTGTNDKGEMVTTPPKLNVNGYNGTTFFGLPAYANRFIQGASFEGLEGVSFPNTVTEAGDTDGFWSGFDGIAYLGFERENNAGWIELDYQLTDTGGFVDVISFAFGSEGEITHAGEIPGDLETLSFSLAATAIAVPEPAHTAAVFALLAGSAALYHRRRKTA